MHKSIDAQVLKVQYEHQDQQDSRGPINAKRERPIFVAFNDVKEARPSSSKRPTFEQREPKEYPILPPFPCDTEKAATPSEQWVDQVIRLAYVVRFLSIDDQKWKLLPLL